MACSDDEVDPGCECCDGEYICCPKPCCEESLAIEWGEKCGTITWAPSTDPIKVDIYLTLHNGKPMLKIVRESEAAAE